MTKRYTRVARHNDESRFSFYVQGIYMMETQKYIASLSFSLLLGTLVVSCGNGGSTPANDAITHSTSIDESAQSDESDIDSALFPPPGPIIDPASTREEIALRADTLLTEYRTLMGEVLPQMNEIYQNVSSGLQSSPDPDIQATDVKFFNAINNSCEPQFDTNGVMTGLSKCHDLSAQLAFRHPRYANVQMLVNDYVPTANFNRGDVTGIYISSGSYSIFDSSFDSDDAVKIVTGKYRVSTDATLDIPMVYLMYPAFSLDRQICMIFLSPTRLPEDSLEVNRCSEMYKDIITVLKRLNRHD